MNKSNTRIEIVRSSRDRLGSMSSGSATAIHDVLKRHFHEVNLAVVNSKADLDELLQRKPDLVFLGVKQITSNGNGIWIADVLETAGISYTGSPANAIELDYNKPKAKATVSKAGLPTAEFFMAVAGHYSSDDVLPLTYPLFIKPPDSGGGRGVGADSVIRNFPDFESKVASIAKTFGTDSLVERYLTGREFTVAIMEKPESGGLLAMPMELITERNQVGDRVIGRDTKRADTESAIPVDDTNVKATVSELAKDVFRALGARGYGRIDIRLDDASQAHFMEANLVPSLTEGYGNFPKACKANCNISYEEMILGIVNLAIPV